MLHRPSIVAGIIATLLAYHPHPARATLLSAPGAQQVQAAPISPAQGKIDEGLKGLRAGDLKAAEDAFTEAARNDPKLPSAYIGLAEVAGRQNNVAQVESWLQKALDADPNSAATQLVWGHYQFQRGRFVKAETAFKRAIELDARFGQTIQVGCFDLWVLPAHMARAQIIRHDQDDIGLGRSSIGGVSRQSESAEDQAENSNEE